MKLLHSRLPLVAPFSLALAACASGAGDSPSSQVPAFEPSGTEGNAVEAPNTPEMDPSLARASSGDELTMVVPSEENAADNITMAAANEDSSEGEGESEATDSLEPNRDDTEGDAVDLELEALLLEGVGDIVRPPPYEYGLYAQRRDDVPRGTVREFTFDENEFYPESPPRGIKVYEPAQYEEGEEVFLSVFFDGTASWSYLSNNTNGGTYRTLNVLDNLIAEEMIPPFIGVFIGNDGDGGHRQSELAPVDDRQARFILEAVLPEVSERYGYNFSSDPKKRSITGESSGGNAAFTVAWERPDAFHRMMGHSSSFSFGPAAGLPNLVRQTEEVKPLRIHLEGGMMDGRHHAAMAAALAEKGYVYQWFNSTGSGHGGPGGDRSFPDGLIWLWKGWDRL